MMAVRQVRLTLSDVPNFIDTYGDKLKLTFADSGRIVHAKIELALCYFTYQHIGADMEFRITQPLYEYIYQAWHFGPAQIIVNGEVVKRHCNLTATEIERLKAEFIAIAYKLYEKAGLETGFLYLFSARGGSAFG